MNMEVLLDILILQTSFCKIQCSYRWILTGAMQLLGFLYCYIFTAILGYVIVRYIHSQFATRNTPYRCCCFFSCPSGATNTGMYLYNCIYKAFLFLQWTSKKPTLRAFFQNVHFWPWACTFNIIICLECYLMLLN